MQPFEDQEALRLGGWDARYAVVRAIAADGDVAAVLVDTNGDGADLTLDTYRRDGKGLWVAGPSGGGAGETGSSWSPDHVCAYGRAASGETVNLEVAGELQEVTATDNGWWLFVTERGSTTAVAPQVVRAASDEPSS